MGMCIGTLCFAPACGCGMCVGKRFDLRSSVAQAAALLVASLLLVGGGMFWYVLDARKCSDLAGPPIPCIGINTGTCDCGSTAANGGCNASAASLGPSSCNSSTVACPDTVDGVLLPWGYRGTPCFSSESSGSKGFFSTVVTFFGLGLLVTGIYWLGLAKMRSEPDSGGADHTRWGKAVKERGLGHPKAKAMHIV